MTEKRYFVLKGLRTFWWNGEVMTKGREVEADYKAKKYLVDEEGLCEVIQ